MTINIAGFVVAFLVLIAWIVYQELSWRERHAAIVDHYEKRLEVEIDLAYKRGLAEGAAKVRSFTFKTYKKTGMFKLRTQQLYLSVTFFGDELKYLAGDVADIEKFQIPPEIQKAIQASKFLIGGQ
jgi:hypothetical protein